MERTQPAAMPRTALRRVAVLDLAAKALLLAIMARVALDPGWGNLVGKAPGTRVVVYPMLAFLIPVAHVVVWPFRSYPWATDLLLTAPAFSDILGNRLDLYDEVVWFDDAVHFVNTGLLATAVLLLSGAAGATLPRRLQMASRRG